MAYPTILFNSSTGSDTAASGAGPATALTGSSAATSGDGLTVTLDGSPDLSGVATDGTHAIWLNDTTAGHRNFAYITGKDDGAKTVTVTTAFTGSLSGKSWAIGGKRLSLAGSLRLVNNNNATGDIGLAGGWRLRFEDSYTETLTAQVKLAGAIGNYRNFFYIEGDPAATVAPVFTTAYNGTLFYIDTGTSVIFDRLKFVATTSLASAVTTLFSFVANDGVLTINNSQFVGSAAGNGFNFIINLDRDNLVMCSNCFFGPTKTNALLVANCRKLSIKNCFFDNTGSSNAIKITSVNYISAVNIRDSFVVGGNSTGIVFNSAAVSPTQSLLLENNTIFNIAASGIDFQSDPTGTYPYYRGFRVRNNLIGKCTDTAVKFSHANATLASLQMQDVLVDSNSFGSGATANGADCNIASLATNSFNGNITFGNTSNLDYSLGDATFYNRGYPLTATIGTNTRSYQEPGAASAQVYNMALYTLISGVAAAGDVRLGTARYSGGANGTLAVPRAQYVLTGQAVDAGNGTLTIPAANQTISTATYGVGGNGTTGTLADVVIAANGTVLASEASRNTVLAQTVVANGTAYTTRGVSYVGNGTVGGNATAASIFPVTSPPASPPA